MSSLNKEISFVLDLKKCADPSKCSVHSESEGNEVRNDKTYNLNEVAESKV